ncbi:hypothetical protein FSP39_021914 [Pinctada imbricata]|uniref:C1q domain-containing protein n=1 Tax=Pinctada imbricata TaxID=66713 RepID=A0AA89C5T0_PINIB|nr:hypothetical protein FSP39_021914 [Pinctada imbricata]
MAPIAFLAELGATITDPAVGSPVIFDVIHLNDGKAYSNVHGIFTAPVAGVYHFTLEISGPKGDASHELHINLMKSTTAVGYVYLDQNAAHWIKRTSTATLHLAARDDVWVKVISKLGVGQIAGCCYHSIFSGFLIKSD